MKIYTINGNTRKPVDGITAGMLRDSLDTDFTLALTLYNSDARRIKKGTVLEYNGNFFDVATRTKYMNGQAPFVDTTANSIFCRLNRAEYALDSFAVNGTPAEIMTAALHGTPFTFGKTDLTGKYTIVVNETSSRRAVLLTIAAQLHGEIEINGYEISLLAHRGSADEIELLDTGVVSDVQEESDDAEGTTSYSITLLHKVNLKAGDNIHLKFDPLEIDAHTRITAIEYNPYNPLEVNIEVGDYEMDIVDSFISASNEIAAAKHEFKVTSEALTSRIESAEGDISSLEQTAESLTSRITSAEGDVSVLQQTAQSLTSRIESAEGDISSLEQTAESLTATVRSKADKYGGTASSFSYSLTANSFELQANGETVLLATSDGLEIVGTVTANSGVFSNCTIDSTCTVNGTITANKICSNAGAYSSYSATGDISFIGGTSVSTAQYIMRVTNAQNTSKKAYVCVYDVQGSMNAAMSTISYGSSGYLSTTSVSIVDTTVMISGESLIISAPISAYKTASFSGKVAMNGGFTGRTSAASELRHTEYLGQNGGNYAFLQFYRNSYGSDFLACSLFHNYDNTDFYIYSWNNGIAIGAASGNENTLVGTWYCNGSVINSSDRNAKNSIADIDEKYSLLFDALRPRMYKYNDGTSGRLHSGFVAQEVDEAATAAGISRSEFAAVCISESGTKKESWGLRYEEFVALNTYEIQKLKARISELEAKIKA